MKVQPLVKSKSELTHGNAQTGPVVLSTRIRLARNLKAFPFPGWAKEAQRLEVVDACKEAIEDLSQMKNAYVFNISELTELEKQVLVERHLISRELSSGEQGGGVMINKGQTLSIMLNEEDHLRIQVVKSGFNFKSTWKAIDALDTDIEQTLDYAFSPELGYLTACPTNLGTGMRASVMMHLPALVMSDQMEKVVRAVNQLGLAVRGLFGEGSDASGSLFQISNQQTLGESEADIIKRLTSVLNTISDQEINARQKLIESEPSKISDRIGRAFGILKSCHVISSTEAMNLLSLMRLAIDLGYLPGVDQIKIDRLFIENQPGHIQIKADSAIDPEQRDVLRAEMLRDEFSDLELKINN